MGSLAHTPQNVTLTFWMWKHGGKMINTVNLLLWQKNVNFEVNYVDEMEFPAVTLCNKNQFKWVEQNYFNEWTI